MGDRPGRVGGVHDRRVEPGAPQVGHQSVEPVELAVGVGVGRLVGDRQVGQHALEHQLGALVDGAGHVEQVGGVAADPVHARVDLDVDGHRRPAAPAGGPGHGLDRRRGVEGEAGAGVDGVVDLVGAGLGEHEHRGVDARVAERHRLVHLGHRQPVGPGLRARPGPRPRRRARSRWPSPPRTGAPGRPACAAPARCGPPPPDRCRPTPGRSSPGPLPAGRRTPAEHRPGQGRPSRPGRRPGRRKPIGRHGPWP